MPVGITTPIEIARPRRVVSAFAADPTNVPRWYANIQSVEWVTEARLQGEDTADGGTRMLLRNGGEPSGFSRLASFIMVPAMRRANRKDLALLKSVLESE